MGTKIGQLLTVFALLLVTSFAHADGAPSAEHILKVDDVIEIVVRNHAYLNRITTISPDGTIAISEVGEVTAAGLTTKKLAATLQTKLEETLNNVFVSVTLKESKPTKFKVNVLGVIRTGGPVEINPKTRLVDLVAAGGGLIAKTSMVQARIFRGTQVILADVSEALEHPESDANVALQSDDIVYFVEVLQPQISVGGQVERPGIVDLTETTTLSTVLNQVGGVTPKAALKNAFVLRKGNKMPLDLRGIVFGQSSGAAVPQFKFQANDLLTIPESTEKYSVLGEARSTGSFLYPSTGKITVMEAYTQVGGKTATGDIANAAIIRFDNGKYSAKPVNIAKLLQKNSKEVDPTLEPGDTLFLPTKRAGGGIRWDTLLGPLSAFTFLLRR